jgi:hypothetical protein
MADTGDSATTPIGRMLQAQADGRKWWELDDDRATTPVDDEDDDDDG